MSENAKEQQVLDEPEEGSAYDVERKRTCALCREGNKQIRHREYGYRHITELGDSWAESEHVACTAPTIWEFCDSLDSARQKQPTPAAETPRYPIEILTEVVQEDYLSQRDSDYETPRPATEGEPPLDAPALRKMCERLPAPYMSVTLPSHEKASIVEAIRTALPIALAHIDHLTARVAELEELHRRTDESRVFHFNKAEEARQERDRLTKENGDLRADRERLDWLERNHGDMECCERTPGKVQWEVDSHDGEYEIGDTLREAIDAALAAHKPASEATKEGSKA